METTNRLTGWVWIGSDIWWYGNGNITPYNWSKQFTEQTERTIAARRESERIAASIAPEQKGQLKIEFKP